MEIRTSPEEARAIAKTAKAQGYANSSAFIRSVLRDEMSGRQELTEAEQRIAASFDRAHERGHEGVQAAKGAVRLGGYLCKNVSYLCTGAAGRREAQAVALARDRYDQFIKSAGRSLHDGSRPVCKK